MGVDEVRGDRRDPGLQEGVAPVFKGLVVQSPAGPHLLGWDRLFVPDGEDATLAQLSEAGEVVEFRRAAYGEVARALGLQPA